MATLTQGMFLASEAAAKERLPSFFEVFMQDRINQSLKPAFRHVAMVIMERYPAAVVLLERFDEVYALLSLLVERQYLQRTDALFAESLYGFRRSRYVAGQMVDLTDRDRRRSLLITILIPYLKSKLDARHARYMSDRGPSDRPEDWRKKLRDAFVAAYPMVHASYEGVFFFYQWAYLLGFRKYYSPLLELSGMVVRRMTREDVERRRSVEVATRRSTTVTCIKVAFLLAVISFKVVEWVHQSAPALAARPTDGVVPPVPDRPQPAVGGVPLPKDPSICPICVKYRVNPAISPSGVAFCYRCIVTHVRDHGSCPVTLQACREEQIRRLYLS